MVMFQVDKVSESPAANSAMLVSGFSSFNSTPREKKKKTSAKQMKEKYKNC